jgi:hypothetical protein
MTETVSPKVQLINDINHAWFKLCDKNIDAEEFDYLYAQDQDHLQYMLTSLNTRLEMMKRLDTLLEMVEKMVKK